MEVRNYSENVCYRNFLPSRIMTKLEIPIQPWHSHEIQDDLYLINLF
jgi:hypothetical protein